MNDRLTRNDLKKMEEEIEKMNEGRYLNKYFSTPSVVELGVQQLFSCGGGERMSLRYQVLSLMGRQ